MSSHAAGSRKPKHLTYRVDEIPARYRTPEQLKDSFHSDDKAFIRIRSFVPSILDPEGGEHTATVEYQAEGEPRIDGSAENIELDKDFRGFTPLNDAGENVAADIIAVTGLGGHAFGSWVNNRGEMWLRDYIPKDLYNRARVLIYGYASDLHGSANTSSLIEYATGFMQDLMGIRNRPSVQDRPIIFIGHSLGGLIIKQALADLKPEVSARLPVRAILFFGTPHHGLNIRALKTMVSGQPNARLVQDLDGHSTSLQALGSAFKKIAGNIKIYSFIEAELTPVVEEIDGKWQRGQHKEMMVSRNSALLHWETEHRTITADHSQMVKLRKGQRGDYLYIVSVLQEALQSAPEKWEGSRPKDVSTSEPKTPLRGSETGSERQLSSQWNSPQSEESSASYLDSSPLPYRPASHIQTPRTQIHEDAFHPQHPPGVQNESVELQESSPEPSEDEEEYEDEEEDDQFDEPSREDQLRAHLSKMKLFPGISDLRVQGAIYQLIDCLLDGGNKAQLQEAEELAREVFLFREANMGDGASLTLSSLETVADVLEMQGKTHDAEHYYSLLIDRAVKHNGEDSEVTRKNKTKMAEFLLRQDRSAEAEMICRALLEERMRLSVSNRKTVDCQILLAECLSDGGNWIDAKDLLQSSLGSLEGMVNDDSLDLLKPLEGLAIAQEKLGNYYEAEVLTMRVIELLNNPQHAANYELKLLDCRRLLASILGNRGEHQRAISMLNGLLNAVGQYDFDDVVYESLSGPHILFLKGQELRKIEGASSAAEEALQCAIRDDNYTKLDEETKVGIQRCLGLVYRDMARYEEAEKTLAQALNLCNEGQVTKCRGQVLGDLAFVQRSNGRLQQAAATFQRAIDALRAEKNIRESFAASRCLVEIHLELGELARAEWILRGFLGHQEMDLPWGDNETLDTMRMLVKVLDSLGKYDAASELRSRIDSTVQAKAVVEQDLQEAGVPYEDSDDDYQDESQDGLPPYDETETPQNAASNLPGVGEDDTSLFTESACLASLKSSVEAITDVEYVLDRLDAPYETLHEDDTSIVARCNWSEDYFFELNVDVSEAGRVSLELSSESDDFLRDALAEIQRTLAPLLVRSHIVTSFNVNSADHAWSVIRTTEELLTQHGAAFSPIEGTLKQSLHRCQLKKTKLFKTSRKTTFRVTHEVMPHDETFLEVCFVWDGGDKDLFQETAQAIVDTLDSRFE